MSNKNRQNNDLTKLQNLSLVDLSGNQILDIIDYPYLKYFISPDEIYRRFNNLINFKTTIVNTPFKFNNVKIDAERIKYLGQYFLILNNDDEYKEIEEISDYFNEECRVKCVFTGSVGSFYDNFRNNIDDLIKHLKQTKRDVTIENLREAVWETGNVTGYKNCSTFKPKILKFFIEHFGAKKVLDISAGWGDRLIGAMASNITTYHGFDPNPCLHKNYKNIVEFFSQIKRNKKSTFVLKQLPFEQANLHNNYYDLVMTSPPYFDIEIYAKDDPTQSTYHTSEREWYENFLTIWIKKCHKALKEGAHLALNINQRKEHKYVYWLLSDMSKNPDWEHLGIIGYSDSSLKNPQPIFIWKKKVSEK